MTYTQLAVLGVAGAVLLDLVVLRTRLLRRRTYWTAYAIVVFFQLVTNGILTGLDIVTYDPGTILGVRIRLRAGRGPAVRLRDGDDDAVVLGVVGAARGPDVGTTPGCIRGTSPVCAAARTGTL